MPPSETWFDDKHVFSLWYHADVGGFTSVGHWLAHKKLSHFGKVSAAATLARLPYSDSLNREVYALLGPRENLDPQLKKSWRLQQPTRVLAGYVLRSMVDKELCNTLLLTSTDTLLFNHPNPETGATAPNARNGAGNTLMQLRMLLKHQHTPASISFLPDYLG